LALLRSNSKTKSEIFAQLNFLSFEEATERALLLKAAQRRRPRIICIDHDQMLPKIGTAEPAARRVFTVGVQGGSGAGKTAGMPERGRISLIVIPNSR